jgi:enamine deaminase RidA (YjgF/YER057c/UK114 family)
MDVQYIRDSDEYGGVPPWGAAAGDFVFFAGGIAADPVNGIPKSIDPIPTYPHHGSSIDRQLRYVFGKMGNVLGEGGSDLKRIMKISTYHTVTGEIDHALRMRREFFNVEEPPASTLLVVPELAVPRLTVTNDVIALKGDAERDRWVLHAPEDDSPLPIHDTIYQRPIFVQATVGGSLIFTSGLTAANLILKGFHERPEVRGLLPKHTDSPYRLYEIKYQTRLTLLYLQSILARLNASLDDVVKVEIHMTNAEDLAGMEEAWSEFFPNDPPARSVYITGLAPTEQLIEVEVIARDPSGPYAKEAINATGVPSYLGGVPHAVRVGPYIFLSGLLATDHESGVAEPARVDPNFPHHSSSAKQQAAYILDTIESICRAAGSSSHNLVRRRVMHTNLAEAGAAEDAWLDALGSRLPPTTIYQTCGPLPVPGCTVAYDIVAVAPS